jgi:hypothetical protein
MNDWFAPDDTRDALRKFGGLLFGLGAAMIFIRKGSGPEDEQWASFPLFLVLAIPAAYLYGGIFTKPHTGGLRVWQAVHSVFGLILIPLALLQFIDMIGGSSGTSLNLFWIFAVTAAAGFYAGAVAGVRVQLLLGSIALIVSWTALWNKILSDGITAHWGIYRGLLGILAIGLLAGALQLWRANPGGDDTASSATRPAGDLGLWKSSELLTGAGIAAVIACSLGISSIGSLNPLATTPVTPIETNSLWDILLLLISLGLVALGSQIGTRGPVYIGAIGLFFFLLIAGLDLNSDTPHPFELGAWPWVLLVLGVLGIGLSGLKDASLGDQPRKFIQNLRGR